MILRQSELDAAVERCTAEPTAVLLDAVERYWSLRWDLPGEVVVPGSLVPDHATNLTWEEGAGRGHDGAVVTGPSTRRFDARLTGRGRVVGVKLRTGVLSQACGIAAADLTDRTVPADDLLPPGLVDAFREAATQPAAHQVVALDKVLASLADLAGPPSEGVLLARRALEQVRSSEVVRVEQLAGHLAVSARTLQRVFREHVGIGPKQVIARLRLRDVVTALEAGTDEPLADLAARLGFFDQAHLAREFTAFVGVPPSRYARGAELDG